MKFLATILIFLITLSIQAQTKLIKHKSHSGTNVNYNPAIIEGNFGIANFFKEYEKDKKSNYKLVATGINGHSIKIYLFYTERKSNQNNVCLKDDRITEEAHFVWRYKNEIRVKVTEDGETEEEVIKRLTKKLFELRKEEKEKK